MSRAKWRLLPVAVLIFSSGILIAEGGLRLLGVEPGLSIVHRLNPYQFDPELGWATRPHSSFLRSSPEYIHYNYYDKDGLPATFENRNGQITPEAPKIVLIGNSYVESYYVPYKKSFPAILDESLRASGKRVLNLGVSGYTPAQYLLQARRHLPKHNVDSVFVFLVPYQDIRFLNSPFFPGGYPKPIFGERLDSPLNTPLSVSLLKKSKTRQLEDYSALLTVLQPLLFKWIGYRNAIYDYPIDFDKMLFSVDEFGDALRYSKQIQTELGSKANVFTVYAPTEFEYHDDRISKNLVAFRQACDQLLVRCLVPPHVEFPPGGNFQVLYYEKDRHPSSTGAALIADFLVGFIKNNP